MFNHKALRLSSILLAVSLLLGLTVVGCSDKDRDKDQEETVLKGFSYVYEKAGGKVDADATNVMVVGVKEDGDLGYAALYVGDGEDDDTVAYTQAVADQYDSETNKYYADTVIEEDVVDVTYIFYKVENNENIYVCSYGIDVSKVGDDCPEIACSEADDRYNPVLVCKDVDGKEATEFNVGDVVEVHVYDEDSKGDELTNYLELTTENTILQERKGTQYRTYEAIAAGEPEFKASITANKVTIKGSLGTITIAE